MATTVCITLDPYTRELTYASAGHPPSLLVDGDRRHRLAARARRSPAARLRAALGDPRGRSSSCPPAATLVAYTDGLVERRDWSIDTGIDLLASVVGSASLDVDAARRPDPRGGRAAIGSHDDIALLIVRLLEVP